MSLTPQEIERLPEYKRTRAVAELTTEQVAQAIIEGPKTISEEVFAMIAERLPEVIGHPGLTENKIAKAHIARGDYETAAEIIITTIRDGSTPAAQLAKTGAKLLSKALLSEHLLLPRISSTDTDAMLLRGDLSFIAQYCAEEFLEADRFFAQYTLEEGTEEEITVMTVKNIVMERVCRLLGLKAAGQFKENYHGYSQDSLSARLTTASHLIAEGNLQEVHSLIQIIQSDFNNRDLPEETRVEICSILAMYYAALVGDPKQMSR